MVSLSSVVGHGDYRNSLAAMRDSMAAQLDREDCEHCHATALTPAERASLMKALHKVLQELEALGPPPGTQEKTRLAEIQGRRGGAVNEPEINKPTGGSKQASRRQGGRRARVNRE